MNTQQYIEYLPIYIKRLEDDGFSKDTIDVSKWITNHFKKYCLENEITEINMNVIKQFYSRQYDIDIYNLACLRQSTLRKPLLTFMELYETGTYYRSHQKKVEYILSENYSNILVNFQRYINDQPLAKTTQHSRIALLYKLLKYLEEQSILSLATLKVVDIVHFIDQITESKNPSTLRSLQTDLRLILNWMHKENYIYFTGKSAIPSLKTEMKNKILSTYSNIEINRILSSINTESSTGKEMYAIICLSAFLGLRSSDIINLRFDEIKWETDEIVIIQKKTNQPLHLPLIDEVKFSLLDYIKNGRHESVDNEYIFTTFRPPYAKFKSSTSVHRIVTRAMDIAGIEYQGRHHGAHALRHSLATNMINNGAPISAISAVLGHKNSQTTEIYITKDTTHMGELTLEVPYGF